jgi:hypothetical protein
MNTISKIHKRLSESLNIPRVLENPEEFLGENFEAVLNFWIILDELSEEQWRVVDERYDDFYDEKYSEWLKARDLTYYDSEGVVGWRYSYVSGWSAHDVVKSNVARWATRELIGMHKILEDQQQPLTFFSMFLEVLCY